MPIGPTVTCPNPGPLMQKKEMVTLNCIECVSIGVSCCSGIVVTLLTRGRSHLMLKGPCGQGGRCLGGN